MPLHFYTRLVFRAIVRPVLLLTGALLTLSVVAQDLHYSQFYLHPQQSNPALTGVFAGQWRAGALYRSQWENVPVQYRTAAGWADLKVKQQSNSLIAAGLTVQQDRAGDAALQWTQVGLSVSASQAISAGQAVSVGLGVGMAQRSFDLSGLKFNNQWNGDSYDASLPNRENLAASSGFAPTLAGGLNWHFEPGLTRTKVDAGLAGHHLNRPDVSFGDDSNYRLRSRWNLYTQATVQTRDRVDVVGFGQWQRLSTAQELVLGAGLRYWLANAVGNQQAIQLTCAVRAGDAFIPAVQIEYNAWTVGVSYDWNVSDFAVATRGRGGFEVGVIYRSLPVLQPKGLKVCPIF